MNDKNVFWAAFSDELTKLAEGPNDAAQAAQKAEGLGARLKAKGSELLEKTKGTAKEVLEKGKSAWKGLSTAGKWGVGGTAAAAAGTAGLLALRGHKKKQQES